MLAKLNPIERLALILCGLLIVLSAGLYLYGQANPPANQNGKSSIGNQLGGDFTLNGLNGPASLSDFKGQGVVLMFGYTSCPDVCPTGLANVGAALGRLEENQQRQIQPIFISVDPERDTPKRLDDYSRYFHPSILGLSGAKTEIDKVVKAYGAFYRMVEMPDSAMQYSVDHSARIYLIDKQGQLAKLVNHNTPVGELSAEIKALL